jgi:hypothetical protein
MNTHTHTHTHTHPHIHTNRSHTGSCPLQMQTRRHHSQSTPASSRPSALATLSPPCQFCLPSRLFFFFVLFFLLLVSYSSPYVGIAVARLGLTKSISLKSLLFQCFCRLLSQLRCRPLFVSCVVAFISLVYGFSRRYLCVMSPSSVCWLSCLLSLSSSLVGVCYLLLVVGLSSPSLFRFPLCSVLLLYPLAFVVAHLAPLCCPANVSLVSSRGRFWTEIGLRQQATCRSTLGPLRLPVR